MEIIIGKTAGFCYGVKRAVEGSLEQVKNKNHKKIYCLGELVHNKQVVSDLAKKGIEFIETIENIETEDGTLIIRSHGVEKDIYSKAKNKKLDVVDYTCPNVLKIHKIAEEYEKQGYYIFLTGVENHPEVIGIVSHCGENFILIKQEEDIENAIRAFEKTKIKKLLMISQTTYSMKKFEQIEKVVKEKMHEDVEIVVKNTICLATEQRQKEVKELSSKVDHMIIIGGKNSSNTKKLYEIAKENCKNTSCIETKEELDKSQYEKVEKIGIMAGASTPQKSIDEVVSFLKQGE